MIHASFVRCVAAFAVLALVVHATPPRAQAASESAEASATPRATAHDATPAGLTANEWSDIRAAYQAQGYAACAVAGGFQVRNAAQHWSSLFDRRGAVTRPDGGGWTWGLALARYGFAGAEIAIREPAHASALDARIAYDWDATLQEWWVNDTRGLEHGFTLRTRPPQCAPGPLTIALAVRGDLLPRVCADGRGVAFSSACDDHVLEYSGLVVLDADGRELGARFDSAGDELLLSIDERDACYPLTIDPIAQLAYLKASNTGPTDEFGLAVAMSGDTVVIGARWEDSNAVGVNGNQADNSAANSGAAYVFVRNGTTWTQQAYLKASNTGADDEFGYSVAISGDTVVVGAIREDSAASGVNGNQADNSLSLAGAAYVFVRSGTTWTQQAYLKASNPGMDDEFGFAVAVSGDTLVVGAFLEDSSSVGVNSLPDNTGPDAGAAYVFVRSGTTWTQQAYLKASNTDFFDRFGSAVAVSGDTVVVGAGYTLVVSGVTAYSGEDSNATGVNGNQTDNSALDSGAVYVFVRSGTTWSQQAYLKASNTQAKDAFGRSVSIAGDTLVIGANGEDSEATGVNGNQTLNGALDAGAAYVFVRSGTTWSQQAYLKASNAGAADVFGRAVSVSGDTIVVGAPGEGSLATGVNGNQADNSALEVGAAYEFVRIGTSWTQRAYLKAAATDTGDAFGTALALSGTSVVVGAYHEDSNATGIDGNQADNSAVDAGAAYVFSLDGTPAGPGSFCAGDGRYIDHTTACPCANNGALGNGCGHSFDANGANLSATGSAVTDDVVLRSQFEPVSSFTLFMQHSALADAVFHDGVLCAGGTLVRLRGRAAVGGEAFFPNSLFANDSTLTLSQRGGVFPGQGVRRYYAAWFRNASTSFCPPATANVTNGWVVDW